MIYFDSTSIYQRELQKLQQDPNWQAIVNNSVIGSLLRSNAEIQAETARYAEYLFKESKWDTASNPSSILAMANMLGYQPKRKISARGQIYVSADPRTHLVGSTISSYKFLEANNSNLEWAVTTDNFNITTNSNVIDENTGINYVPIPRVFNKNTKYVTLNLIQGIRKSAVIDINTIRNTATASKLDPYLYIPIQIDNCEDASNSTSRAFFRVYVIRSTGDTPSYTEYRVTDTLLLSSSSDYDVEVYNDLYSQNLFYLKFNNDSTRGNVLDISQNTSITAIRVDYIESLGDAGNTYDLFHKFTITNTYDTNNNLAGLKLYGVNFDPIIGGKDEETVADIKENAPKFYVNNYTAGTKEAYETVIGNMDFVINGMVSRPKQVQVYGGQEQDENGNVLPVTCISFIADGLEDLVTDSTQADPYASIEESLNYYLERLKSPQDSLKFVPPNYISFALGLHCRIDKSVTDDIAQLESNIRTFIDDSWGSRSNEIDFERNFYPSQIITDIMNNFSEVTSITTEVEAVKKLDWMEAERISPKTDTDSSSTIIHTIRIPFSFDPIFLGNQSTKGFKDYRVGSDYVIRFDVMYKKPKAMTQNANYHVTILVQDGKTEVYRKPAASTGEITDAFYYKKDTTQEGIWLEDFSQASTDYNFLHDISRLETSQQYYYREEVLNDNDYRSLIDESSEEYSPTISTYLVDLGAIDDYMIYFSSDYDEDGDDIGNGWLELTFDPIYKILSQFSMYDADLSEQLQACPLSLLKCNNANMAETFSTYLNILANYVDIYVSMRPIDSDLIISTSMDTNTGSTVLYIDSYDNTSLNNTADLTSSKRQRMISISCEYEE